MCTALSCATENSQLDTVPGGLLGFIRATKMMTRVCVRKCVCASAYVLAGADDDETRAAGGGEDGSFFRGGKYGAAVMGTGRWFEGGNQYLFVNEITHFFLCPWKECMHSRIYAKNV